MAKLRDEFVAGRLSQDTFLHRVDLVLETRRQADLPPLVADLPAGPYPGGALARWIRGTWARVTGSGTAQPPGTPALGQSRDAAFRVASAARRPGVMVTTGMNVAPARRRPFAVQFPRGGGDRFTIGRDASCDLAVADLTVSRQHAQLERTDSGWLLSDLESTNGTRVNGWRVRGPVPVRPGDLVSFGNLEVVFESPPA